MLMIFLCYFAICLLIKITLILGAGPSKHDYILCGVSVLSADVPKAESWQAAAARECLIVFHREV